MFAAVHLEADIGRIALCAEAIALGMAVAAGEPRIATIVAVDARGHVLPPCGMCREMIADYDPRARVLLMKGERLAAVPIGELIPFKTPGYLANPDA